MKFDKQVRREHVRAVHPQTQPARPAPSQSRSEFGRTWAAPKGRDAASAAAGGASAAAAGADAPPAAGRAVASFYSALVGTSSQRQGWVSGGRLQDGEPEAATVTAAAAGTASSTPAVAAPADERAQGEALHAGLGSAAARAELEAEAAQLQYSAPAGPALRGEQAAGIQGPAGGAQQAEQAAAAGRRRAPHEGVRYGIARGNIGFQLLKKAGWTEGSGLGAQEQGIPEPLAAFHQKGNLGLGFAPKPKPAPAAAGGGGERGSGAAGQQQQQARGVRPLPEDPLDKEDTATKVKRVKQVMQAEADDKAGKAIARYIHMAFSDATGEPTRDTNPLLRRHSKLSAKNPLL